LPRLVREIAAEGFGVSAVSGGELVAARRGDVPNERTALEGIGKTERDLRAAARAAAAGDPLLWVSLETVEDAAALSRVVSRAGGRFRQDVLVRVNPAVSPETSHGLAVGAATSKFGVLPEELGAVIEAGGGAEGPLRWRGIHLHVGSQLGAVDAWRSAFRVGLRLLELQRAELTDFDTLDAGGGFPADMTSDSADRSAVPTPELFARAASAELAELAASSRRPRLAIEPGRAVVAGCGTLVARVLHVRQRERPIVVLDAGMTELIRPALYGAAHPMTAVTSLGRPVSGPHEATMVRLDGPVCESTDTLGDAAMPELARDDIVAIGMAGAYGASMASTYNGRPLPAEVAWDGERLELLRRGAQPRL
jgi:diaminopimelate decarboxylase